jgi:hypothetical protein
MVDFFDLSPLHVQRAAVSLEARSGVRQDVLLRARGPRRARKGQRIRVRLTVQRRRGGRHRISVPVRVPRSLRPGMHRLTLRGTAGGSSDAALVEEIIAMLEGAIGPGGAPREARTVRQLGRRLRSFRRTPGITARFDRGPRRLVRRSQQVSYEGRVRLRLRVTARGRR